MNDYLPHKLKEIQEHEPWRRCNELHWLLQQTIEKRRKAKGLLVDTVRRYRYHLLPETPLQIIRYLYGKKIAGQCMGMIWVQKSPAIKEDEGTTDATVLDAKQETLDRWEAFYREKDYPFVLQEYKGFSPTVIDAIFDLCLFSLRDGRLDNDRLVRLKQAVNILVSLPQRNDDFRIVNLISAGNETLKFNENLKKYE